MRAEAIFELHTNVVQVVGSGSSAVAYDASGAVVSYTEATVAAKETELDNAFHLAELRTERNKKLAETDHWMFSDTATATQAQLDYRQDLRDITGTYSSLDTVVWPTKP